MAGRGVGPAQRLVPSDRAAWCQRLGDVGWIGAGGDAEGLGTDVVGALALPAIADFVVVDLVKVVLAVGLPLAARGGEEALFALAATANAWRVVGVIDGA